METGEAYDAEQAAEEHGRMAPTLLAYRQALTERVCRWCKTDIGSEPIKHYRHDAGWPIQGQPGLHWLYIECPYCKYEWALWKLGVKRYGGETS